MTIHFIVKLFFFLIKENKILQKINLCNFLKNGSYLLGSISHRNIASPNFSFYINPQTHNDIYKRNSKVLKIIPAKNTPSHQKMASKSFCFFFLVLYSWVFVGFSQGGGSNLPCMQKLLPCQPYLKSSSTPPAACCVPLKQIIADDSKCLCAVFNNPGIMKGLNATQEDALNMAKHCGSNADASGCKTGDLYISFFLQALELI